MEGELIDGMGGRYYVSLPKYRHLFVEKLRFSNKPWDWWTSRLAMDLAAMEYIGKPEEMCDTIMEFQADKNDLTQLQEAGVNPYVYLEIVEAPRCQEVMAQA